jgi:hypothetical protein
MRAHLIENWVVANTIEVKSLEIRPTLINGETGGGSASVAPAAPKGGKGGIASGGGASLNGNASGGKRYMWCRVLSRLRMVR